MVGRCYDYDDILNNNLSCGKNKRKSNNKKKRSTTTKIQNTKNSAIIITSSIIIYLLSILSNLGYSQKIEEWEFFHPDPSLEATGGLFRAVSPRTMNFRTFSIGTYFGYFNTPNNTIMLISREHFALKEGGQEAYFEKFNSYGLYNYINVSAGLPQKNIGGGMLSSDISISARNSSVFLENQIRGEEIIRYSSQVLGDVIITPKISYLFERKDLSFSLWPKVTFLARIMKGGVGATLWAIGFSALYDFDENPSLKSEKLSLINPRFILSISYNFDNSKLITQNITIPSYVETQLFIEPYNHLDLAIGVEAGNSKKGIGEFVSGFVEWSFMRYFPSPRGAKFSDMPMFISLGIRWKPIPIISKIIKGIPEGMKELSIFTVGDFNLSRVYSISFPPGPDVKLRNSPSWRLFFGLNIIWSPCERARPIEEGGRIKIKVLDEISGEPIPDAIVSYPGLEVSQQATDEFGEVISYEIQGGEQSIMVRKEGYEVFVTKLEVKKGEVKEVEIKMKKK